MYSEVELLDHIVIPFLILWETILFPIADIPFYTPPKDARKFVFQQPHQYLLFFACLFLIVAYLMNVWYLVVLLFIYDMSCDTEYPFMCLLTICIFSWINFYSSLHPLLNQVVLFFVVEFLQHLSIFWTLIIYQINNFQSSPHFMGCLFTLLIFRTLNLLPTELLFPSF